MKTIVCYGDSNTWGFMPKRAAPDWSDNRFAWDVRWTGILQKALGAGYRVEEEGLNGRTTCIDDPLDVHRNGLKYIDTCMLTKMPVDLVVLMLGTNDVKDYLGVTPLIASLGIAQIVEHIQAGGYGPKGASPKVLIVSPPSLSEGLRDAWPGEEFGAHALEKDAGLAAHHENVARKYGASFLNAARFVKADSADCVHLNQQGHALLGEKIAEEVRRILG
ncbi:MAG: SGNH/GDSL hydrolase family protein [Clostridia bacterium]